MELPPNVFKKNYKKLEQIWNSYCWAIAKRLPRIPNFSITSFLEKRHIRCSFRSIWFGLKKFPLPLLKIDCAICCRQASLFFLAWLLFGTYFLEQNCIIYTQTLGFKCSFQQNPAWGLVGLGKQGFPSQSWWMRNF